MDEKTKKKKYVDRKNTTADFKNSYQRPKNPWLRLHLKKKVARVARTNTHNTQTHTPDMVRGMSCMKENVNLFFVCLFLRRSSLVMPDDKNSKNIKSRQPKTIDNSTRFYLIIY